MSIIGRARFTAMRGGVGFLGIFGIARVLSHRSWSAGSEAQRQLPDVQKNMTKCVDITGLGL
ncbi:hypothetical protein DQK91_10395 [Oceanidesulfovibrio marinus]|uniref:Uncharacterized protein n=1 Tax=Oceanidesulfovibrio marinus TaxID=370038 RepID=A0A6P1ZFP6_9BACT|nr:hypothetical protein DQK91_10395 [Oceanidesulfovibrio marinus]